MSFNTASLADGAHTIRFLALDTADNWGDAGTHTFYVDNNAPGAIGTPSLGGGRSASTWYSTNGFNQAFSMPGTAGGSHAGLRSLALTLGFPYRGGDQVMSIAYADEAVHIREVAPLTARDIARATGAGQSTVEAWLARTRVPSGTRAERLLELAAIVEQAARVLRPDAIQVWLNKPVPSLHQDKPIDVIARGDYRRVADLLAGLETATFS